MSEQNLSPLRSWLAAPLDRDVAEALERIRHAPDVQQIAVMPDVHLASDICIGVAVATLHLIYPQAVGGDIGCGMLAVAFDAEADALHNPKTAGALLAELSRTIPARRRNRNALINQPTELMSKPLSHLDLEAVRKKEGVLEFATLGSGNHFLEFQADEENRLWLMIHSGSRALGPAIRDHHMARAQRVDGRFRALDAESDAGQQYLRDAAWARRYATASRMAMATEAEMLLANTMGAKADWETLITTDHNHVALEEHGGQKLWVHRKGAMSAQAGEPGVMPGSMGTVSFHVEGRGCEEALCSSAHGAGRALSRSAARSKISEQELRRQMKGVWFDHRLSSLLRDEAPSAYKDTYLSFANGMGNDGKPSLAMDSLKRLTGGAFSLHYVLLLAAANFPKVLFDHFVSQLESFLFYYIFTKTPTKDLERNFSVWADELRKIVGVVDPAQQIQQLNSFIAERFNKSIEGKSQELVDALNRLTLFSMQQYRTRYLLARLTQHVDMAFSGIKVPGSLAPYSKLEIEHILPNNPTQELRNAWGHDNPNARYDDYKIRLGNLTLLEKPINIVAGNDFYAAKKLEYRKSANYLTRSLVELAEIGQNTTVGRINQKLKAFPMWDAGSVEMRYHMLVALVQDIWITTSIPV